MATQIPDPGSYAVDPARSTITFHTRHLLGLAKVTGTLGVKSGVITIGSPVSTSSVQASADVASFKTNSAKRDKDVMKPNLLDAARYPVISFESSSVRQRDGQWVVTGQLTARGQAAPFELTVTSATATGNGLRLFATGTADRYAHGITGGKGIVARRLRIDLDVAATR